MKRRRISLAHGNVRLAVTDTGEAMAPVVLVHGLGGSQLAFKRVAALLAGRARVITYDQRGHGASGVSDDYSWDALVADLGAVIEHLELRDPVLVGHSLGAGVALCSAARYGGLGKR
jgi:pimeloyl-ACP methyl ester carboxylesterase